MIGIIGTKLGMTQIFNESGQQIPCTVVEAAPNPVITVTDKEQGRLRFRRSSDYGTQRLRRESRRARSARRAAVARTRRRSATRRRRGSMRRRAVLRSLPSRRRAGKENDRDARRRRRRRW